MVTLARWVSLVQGTLMILREWQADGLARSQGGSPFELDSALYYRGLLSSLYFSMMVMIVHGGRVMVLMIA
jgi:hypothetical protein